MRLEHAQPADDRRAGHPHRTQVRLSLTALCLRLRYYCLNVCPIRLELYFPRIQIQIIYKIIELGIQIKICCFFATLGEGCPAALIGRVATKILT